MAAPLSPLNPLVLLLDRYGSVLRWSRAFRHYSRQPLEALLGNLGWERIFQESDAKMLGSILAQCRTKSEETTEHSWTTRGDPFDTSWSALTIASPGGLVEFVVVTGVRREANATPLSVGSTPGGLPDDARAEMWAFDRGTYRLLDVTEATSRRYGYTQDELRSMRVMDLSPWEDVSRLVALVTDLSAEQRTEVRWRHRRKDGDLLDIEAELVATESAGRPACLVLAREAG
jgi:PAS domain S-box-containing protein